MKGNNNVAIKVENLCKCYHIYDNPRDRLKQIEDWGQILLFLGVKSAKHFIEN